jgi:hypothetical protein
MSLIPVIRFSICKADKRRLQRSEYCTFSQMRYTIVTLCCGALVAGLVLSESILAAERFPTNNDPANQIRFNTSAEADARRMQLIKFIWNGDLPKTKPHVAKNVAFPEGTAGIDSKNISSVDRLDADVSGWDFHCISYLMHPTKVDNANRIVVVHQGHANDLDAGVGATANHFLQNGFTVIVMKMPLFGWSADKKANLPSHGEINYRNHDEMILNTGPKDGGWGFRLFLEPVVQNINYAVAAKPDLIDISMIGLSGGGWTTSLMSAVDPRIKLSVPVAGSAPLYQRNADATPGTIGDAEQFYQPLFGEDIHADGSGGGIATWLEIYALGGYGTGRRQVKVTNEFDSCCFGGKHSDGYKSIVADKVKQLGEGQWEHTLDSTHRSHMISDHVIAAVIDPLFGIVNAASRKSPANKSADATTCSSN